MTNISISNKTRIFEIIAVIITAGGKFIFMDFLKLRFPFIVTVTVFWICYVLYRRNKNPDVINYWGFRTDNFMKVVRIILPFAVFSLILFVALGFYQNTINITWHILPLLVLYPAWGLVQQFLLIALTAGNLYDLKNKSISKGMIIIVSALLFGAIHYPYVWLMIATFVLAILYSLLYLEQRNLYALGIFHGWLAAIFFYTIVNRDPFMETFGPLLRIGK
jgi:hypothetical protein